MNISPLLLVHFSPKLRIPHLTSHENECKSLRCQIKRVFYASVYYLWFGEMIWWAESRRGGLQVPAGAANRAISFSVSSCRGESFIHTALWSIRQHTTCPRGRHCILMYFIYIREETWSGSGKGNWWRFYGNSWINPLHTKRRPLYLKTQSVPRCKHFSSGL